MEVLLDLCLEGLDDLGEEALEILCRRSPERAVELRARIGGLKRGRWTAERGSLPDADTARWLDTLLLLALLRSERRKLSQSS